MPDTTYNLQLHFRPLDVLLLAVLFEKKRDSNNNNNNNRSPKFEYYNFTKFVITIEALNADMDGLDRKKMAQF